AGALHLEAQRDVEDRRDVSLDEAPAARGGVDAGEQLQERALARPVVADDADPLAGLDAQAQVAQGAHLHRRLGPLAPEQAADHVLLERAPARVPLHVEGQAHAVQFDARHGAAASGRGSCSGGGTPARLRGCDYTRPPYRWKMSCRWARLQTNVAARPVS